MGCQSSSRINNADAELCYEINFNELNCQQPVTALVGAKIIIRSIQFVLMLFVGKRVDTKKQPRVRLLFQVRIGKL